MHHTLSMKQFTMSMYLITYLMLSTRRSMMFMYLITLYIMITTKNILSITIHGTTITTDRTMLNKWLTVPMYLFRGFCDHKPCKLMCWRIAHPSWLIIDQRTDLWTANSVTSALAYYCPLALWNDFASGFP